MDVHKASFWGWLTKEGRLKNQWARGLEEADPLQSLNQLRQVQQKLMKNPAEFTHLWMSFLDTFFDASRVSALTDSDMKAVEEMGDVISQYSDVQIRAEDVWLRVLQAYDTRKEERKARALLTYIYNAPSASREVKIKCARDLAKRGARGDDQLKIYIDHLQHVSDSSKEIEILKLLSSLCAVDFDSDGVRLKRAGEVAQCLVESKLQVLGLQTTLGLHALLIEQMPSKAVKHFETALQANPHDRTALVGLLASLMQTGDYSKVAKTVQNTVHSDDTVVTGLVNLSTTLQWLSSHEIAGQPPCNAQNLSLFDIGKYARDSFAVTIGILHLLEGNAKQAEEILLPLAEKHPEQYQWNYYAAWAASLTGNREAVARRFAALAKWKGRWTVACILLDTDTTLAEAHGVYAYLSQVPSAYTGIVAARLALARGTSPDKTEWKYKKDSTLVENLETFRTVLGCAIYTQDIQTVKQMVAMPIFQRLPLADQLLWRGLYLLCAHDHIQGCTLLEEAAIKFGYQRAALALSVHFLEQNKIQKAKQLLDRAAAGRKEPKTELLYAYIEVCEGKIDTAARRLDKLVVKGEAKAHYALGNLYLQRADDARKSGDLEHFRFYSQQAAGSFRAALKTGRVSPPSDCEVLAQCVEFFANPERENDSYKRLWHEVEQIDAHRRLPWLVWNAFLAQLWWGSPSEIADSGKKALALLETIDSIENSALATVASAIAHACVRAENVSQADKLVAQLGYLSNGSKQQAIKPFYRLGVSAAARMSYMKAQVKSTEPIKQKMASLLKADLGNGNLALVLVQVNLKEKKLEEAAAALRNAQPEDLFEKHLCACLADLFQGHAVEGLPQPPPDAVPEVIQACHLLQAAVAFVAGMQDQGYKAVLDAMKCQVQDTTNIVNFIRFLPALCMHSTSGVSVPQPLIEAIRKISGVDGERATSVARCAAAIGEVECACRLWEQVLAKQPNSPLNHEYAEFLCHLAIVAYNSGNCHETVEKLRVAATLGGKQHERD
jgi:tetratricopeptide (TPR) repeat protein